MADGRRDDRSRFHQNSYFPSKFLFLDSFVSLFNLVLILIHLYLRLVVCKMMSGKGSLAVKEVISHY